MKKAKIMLLAIAVFAVVGTALAFKVKTIGSTQYCWLETDTQPAQGECKEGAVNALMDPVGSSNFFYTTTTNAANCGSAFLNCPKVARGFRP